MRIQKRFHDVFLAVNIFTYTDPHFKFTFCPKVLCCTRSRLPSCRPLLPALIFLGALILCLLYFPPKLQEADEPTAPSSFLFTTSSVLIPPPGAQSPHHNTDHSSCPQAVPSSSSKHESPKSWHHGDPSPRSEKSTGRPCILAGILALLLPLSIIHHMIIYHCKFC